MPTRGSSPPLTDRLCSLAESLQMQMQTARSAALDAGALGVMAVDAAFAELIANTGGAHQVWIVALVLLGLSSALAVAALRLPGPSRPALRSMAYTTLATGRTILSSKTCSSKDSRKISAPTDKPWLAKSGSSTGR
jgi:hypothetical protein